MNRPSRPVRVLASVLAAGPLLAAGACSDADGASDTVSISPVPEGSGTAPAAERSPDASPTPALTRAGAKAALITSADLEGDWTQANDAASWRDRLLLGKVDIAAFRKAKAAAADCQKLLDGLYSDSLLGRTPGASALTGFTDPQARLLYQVGDYGQDSLTKSLDWFRTLPQKCDQFTATGSDGGKRTVQVVAAPVPTAGDDRAGLTVTVKGTADGQPATLTTDVAALRVGAAGATVSNGGLSGADRTSTEAAVRAGAQRLKDVLAGKTPAPNPSEFD
ncbi:hypothetical protein [Streptomyces shenzhenensis]|uniref:hypothetical protein n=1 Tax=Streptomyces shenzhenensis TaxID=943815 RepID=UPI00217D11EF|nr:hypothetical protein [Streptomyces shenzhenensis]